MIIDVEHAVDVDDVVVLSSFRLLVDGCEDIRSTVQAVPAPLLGGAVAGGEVQVLVDGGDVLIEWSA